MNELREVAGIKILLLGTEATGFSALGRLTNQIFAGLREKRKMGDDEVAVVTHPPPKDLREGTG